jgi:hypothetical protein
MAAVAAWAGDMQTVARNMRRSLMALLLSADRDGPTVERQSTNELVW